MLQYKQIAVDFLRQYISTYRKHNKLSQEKMAERMRITSRAYADIEHGRYGPSASTLLFLIIMLDKHELTEMIESFRCVVAQYEAEPAELETELAAVE